MFKGIGGLKRILAAGLSLSLILGGTGTSLSAQAQELALEQEQVQEIVLEQATEIEEEPELEAELQGTKEDALESQYHELEEINDSPDVNRASIHDGAILHAFCWDFNTIKENMAAIAEAGFTAVQTSPINECLSTHDALSLDGTLNGTDGMWYYHYQPTDWKIGNYQLGTREEFKAMCDEADKYGIGVIVDILPNHTTPTDDQISQSLIDAAGGWDKLFHKGYRDGVNYNDRVSVTYNAMGGLYDVDTENPDFQNYFYAYLEDCINCGADGFRIDTAKHIALPDDGVPASYEGEEDRNNFYPNMTAALDQYAAETGRKDYDNLFVYGEVLQGDMDRFAAYQQYIGGTTASNYGSSIRSALSNDNFSTSNILSYKIYDEGDYKADENKLVTWVESHDNYINDKSYAVIDDRDTVLGWAIIAARKSGTPLFFSRPDGSSASEPFGNNILGAAGNDLYKDPAVAAVNKFRTAMAGKEEYLSNPDGDKHVLMIERLDAGADAADGAVLVNNSSNVINIKGETRLPDGSYVNQVEGTGDVFVVEDGVISGMLQPESVVVLTEKSDVDYSICHFYNAYGWKEITARVFYAASEHLINGVSEGDGWYRFNIPAAAYDINFCNAENLDDCSAIYLYDYRHWYDEPYFHPSLNGCYGSKEEVLDALGVKVVSVYFFNTDLWENVNCYAWLDGGDQLFGGWPGQAAVNEGDYWYRADLKLPKDHEGGYNVIFNYNGTQTQDIKIDDEKVYVALNAEQPGGSLQVTRFASKKEAEEARGISADSTTVHFYNKDKWDTVYTYTWGAYNTGEWPGIPCTDEGDGWWEITIPAAPGADFNIIFNNGGKGAQTSDLKIPDINHRYVYDDRIFGSKEEALNAEPEEIIPAYPEGTEVTRIYYYDENNWGKVAAYAWSYDGAYNNCIGTWPGTRMYSGEDGWYYTDVPTEAINNGELKLIFNRMGSSQLGDKELESTTKVYFTTSSTTGFYSKEEALGIEPIEPAGRLVKKWGALYYIYEDGSYGTGFITVDDETYFFKDNHKALKNSFIEIDGKSYFFDSQYHMVKGFMNKWLSTYYFDENGVEAVSTLVTVEDRTLYFDVKGHMVKSKFVDLEDGRHYFDKEGNMVRSATITKWGKKYTFDENGKLIK
ncbi:starch-binding protein [Butyrivibrio sp. MC2021]|uniref:starch-binding protein n=1 Tax=Butyrivibrio sp. MC2021 TaxID=1408306 RepID=UPI000684FD66|nr:starch-binding protein [Butyrivibrio sp. MC2021]